MKIGLLREMKSPPDKRVVLTPQTCFELKSNHPNLEIFAQNSPFRAFKDIEYKEAGCEIVEDLSHCDVLLGVKEVPINTLIPNKKYFFFSHTIKKQPYNKRIITKHS